MHEYYFIFIFKPMMNHLYKWVLNNLANLLDTSGRFVSISTLKMSYLKQ
jgi:hypothetical protein